MPNQLLSIGVPVTLVQNRVYALPAARGAISCTTPAAVIHASNDPTFTQKANDFVMVNGSQECSGLFIRSTTPNSVVVFKRA